MINIIKQMWIFAQDTKSNKQVVNGNFIDGKKLFKTPWPCVEKKSTGPLVKYELTVTNLIFWNSVLFFFFYLQTCSIKKSLKEKLSDKRKLSKRPQKAVTRKYKFKKRWELK